VSRPHNEYLRARRLELGLSYARLTRATGICMQIYFLLETMRVSPLRKRGDERWKDVALILAEFHGVSPDELFPPSVLAVTNPAYITEEENFHLLEIEEEFPSVAEVYEAEEMASTVRAAIKKIRPRYAKIIRQLYGLGREDSMTLAKVGAEYGVCRERIRQIESHILYTLHKNKDLAVFVSSVGPPDPQHEE
jgi:transcriptional regulator with XRE-family HTH domain